MTRAEHIRWCKQRALTYFNQGDLQNAVASMLSDLNKHPETQNAAKAMGPLGLLSVMQNDRDGVRRFIEGFRE